jgi:phosphatidylserine decarboxylase
MTSPRKPDGGPALSAAQSLYMQLIHLLPRNALSRAVGDLSEIALPEAAREWVYQTFADAVGAVTEEAERPLREYPTLNAFFTRELRAGLRPIDAAPRALVSPVDARLSEFGRIEDGMLVQAKGRLYALRELVASAQEARAFEGGAFMTLYLSPKDYHQVHFAADGVVRGFAYHPGHLFPVNAPSVQSVDGLFCVNERVCVYQDAYAPHPVSAEALRAGAYEGTPLASILVGATCVGRMTLAFDSLITNVPGARSQRVIYAEGRAVARGDKLGAFNLGSTVILLIGGESFRFAPGLAQGDVIRLGQRLGTC